MKKEKKRRLLGKGLVQSDKSWLALQVSSYDPKTDKFTGKWLDSK